MATSSPASSSRGGEESGFATLAFNGSATPQTQRTSAFDMPKTSLRGLNKPKCVQCGNVARSRCPFQCCKNCCYTAQNPCHIHVLVVKQNSTLPEKTPTNASPSLEQTPKDTSSINSSWRLNSLRQLSSRYLDSLRARKQPGKKDTGLINKWKITKLREHMQENVEAECEAFDRYMQNVSLLEEVFSESTSDVFISNVRLGLKSDVERSAAFKERLRNIVDQKLMELNGINYEGTELLEVVRQRSERNSATNDLITRLSKVRGEDDLKPCIEICARLVGDMSEGQSYCFSNKACVGLQVDQELVSKIDAEFSSSKEVVQL
ncbi:Uveal autoantigen with coiled-coil domains and ankyrin repeats [Rhynchospora pubera]|uniref:Uveal autoantigen with coiled-coil domains and ankyrin repeats n=1 Tax=Rhynchospora pubera TaxID=906938 RepID=A0AAV8GL76_9POAL|nr:Uveal autoantigen with coiled-coil domains and ankyrin repeats [Rhynchospora pubera]